MTADQIRQANHIAAAFSNVNTLIAKITVNLLNSGINRKTAYIKEFNQLIETIDSLDYKFGDAALNKTIKAQLKAVVAKKIRIVRKSTV